LNSFGQTGTGISSNTFIQVGVSNEWLKIGAGHEHSLGIQNDGSIWGWGRNGAGQVSTNAGLDVLFPVLVDNQDVWNFHDGGGNYTISLNDEGDLFSRGYNASGQLGNGTNSDWSVPVLVICPSSLATIEYTGFDVKLSPNPATDVLYVDYPNGSVLTVTIYDIKGVSLKSLQLGPTNRSFSIREFADGFYFVEISDFRNRNLARIIKH
jgi:hypothetical protein